MTSQPTDQLPKLPFIGSAAHVAFDPVGIARKAARIGPVVPLKLLNKTLFMINHPDAAKHVLMDNAPNYTKQTRGYDRLREFVGNGLGTAEGETWRQHRRIIQPAFARKAVEGYAKVMAEVTAATLDAWPKDKPLSAMTAMTRLSMRIIGECMMGLDFGKSGRTIGSNVEEIMQRNHLDRVGVRKLAWWRRSDQEVRADLDRIVYKIIADRRKADEANGGDFLSILLRAQDAEQGPAFDDRQVRDEIVTMIIAGHETMANTLTWALHYISTNPVLQERLIAEVDQGDEPTLLRAVIQETLRLRPSAWLLSRSAVEADRIGDVDIPAGAGIVLNIYSIHRHPEFWVRAEQFDPERWLDAPELHRCAFIPFGAGKRACIGQGMAMVEGTLIIQSILRKFRIRPATKGPVRAAPMLTMRPKGGVPLIIEPRRSFEKTA